MGGGKKVSCEAEERSPGGLAGRVAGGVGKCCVGAGDCVGMGSPNAEERRSRKEAGRHPPPDAAVAWRGDGARAPEPRPVTSR